MRRDYVEAPAQAPVRQRYAGELRYGYCRGNARYSLANHTSGGEREHFLPAAPEDKGVPALEPHDYVARARLFDKQGVYLGLRRAVPP